MLWIYLVIVFNFLRPSSPSYESSSSAGIAIVRSCIIMEDVIYGVTPNAKIAAFERALPVTALSNDIIPLNSSLSDTILAYNDLLSQIKILLAT